MLPFSAKADQDEHALLSQLDTLRSQNHSNSNNNNADEHSANALLNKIVFGEAHEAVLAELLVEKKQRFCGAIWERGAIAYRCKECGLTDMSCVCVDCFRNGPHATHDFVMYRSECGGCCDCGDPLVWRSDGFCTKHTHDHRTATTSTPNTGVLSPATIDHSSRVVRTVCRAIISELWGQGHQAISPPNSRPNRETLDAKFVALLCKWVAYFAGVCGATNDIVVEVLCGPVAVHRSCKDALACWWLFDPDQISLYDVSSGSSIVNILLQLRNTVPPTACPNTSTDADSVEWSVLDLIMTVLPSTPGSHGAMTALASLLIQLHYTPTFRVAFAACYAVHHPRLLLCSLLEAATTGSHEDDDDSVLGGALGEFMDKVSCNVLSVSCVVQMLCQGNGDSPDVFNDWHGSEVQEAPSTPTVLGDDHSMQDTVRELEHAAEAPFSAHQQPLRCGQLQLYHLRRIGGFLRLMLRVASFGVRHCVWDPPAYTNRLARLSVRHLCHRHLHHLHSVLALPPMINMFLRADGVFALYLHALMLVSGLNPFEHIAISQGVVVDDLGPHGSYTTAHLLELFLLEPFVPVIESLTIALAAGNGHENDDVDGVAAASQSQETSAPSPPSTSTSTALRCVGEALSVLSKLVFLPAPLSLFGGPIFPASVSAAEPISVGNTTNHAGNSVNPDNTPRMPRRRLSESSAIPTVSVFIPVHRVLSALMRAVVVGLGHDTALSWFVNASGAMDVGGLSAGPSHLQHLIWAATRKPLSVIAFHSQVASGLWKFNGGAVFTIREHQISTPFIGGLSISDLDLFLVSLLCPLLHPAEFVQNLATMFRLSPGVSPGSSPRGPISGSGFGSGFESPSAAHAAGTNSPFAVGRGLSPATSPPRTPPRPTRTVSGGSGSFGAKGGNLGGASSLLSRPGFDHNRASSPTLTAGSVGLLDALSIEHRSRLLEQFMFTLKRILAFHPRTDWTVHALLRRRVVRQLSSGPMTHSQLWGALFALRSQAKQCAEQIIQKITFHEADAEFRRVYKLKPEAWWHFDVAESSFSRQELEQIFENFPLSQRCAIAQAPPQTHHNARAFILGVLCHPKVQSLIGEALGGFAHKNNTNSSSTAGIAVNNVTAGIAVNNMAAAGSTSSSGSTGSPAMRMSSEHAVDGANSRSVKMSRGPVSRYGVWAILELLKVLKIVSDDLPAHLHPDSPNDSNSTSNSLHSFQVLLSHPFESLIARGQYIRLGKLLATAPFAPPIPANGKAENDPVRVMCKFLLEGVGMTVPQMKKADSADDLAFQQRKRELARARQAELLQQFRTQQLKVSTTMGFGTNLDVETSSSGSSAGNQSDSENDDSAHQLQRHRRSTRTSVASATSCNRGGWVDDDAISDAGRVPIMSQLSVCKECVVCLSTTSHDSDNGSVDSTLVALGIVTDFAASENPDAVFVRVCGHAAHQSCLKRFFGTPAKHPACRGARHEFLCPCCRFLCNVDLPMHLRTLGVVLPGVRSFDDWFNLVVQAPNERVAPLSSPNSPSQHKLLLSLTNSLRQDDPWAFFNMLFGTLCRTEMVFRLPRPSRSGNASSHTSAAPNGLHPWLSQHEAHATLMAFALAYSTACSVPGMDVETQYFHCWNIALNPLPKVQPAYCHCTWSANSHHNNDVPARRNSNVPHPWGSACNEGEALHTNTTQLLVLTLLFLRPHGLSALLHTHVRAMYAIIVWQSFCALSLPPNHPALQGTGLCSSSTSSGETKLADFRALCAPLLRRVCVALKVCCGLSGDIVCASHEDLCTSLNLVTIREQDITTAEQVRARLCELDSSPRWQEIMLSWMKLVNATIPVVTANVSARPGFVFANKWAQSLPNFKLVVHQSSQQQVIVQTRSVAQNEITVLTGSDPGLMSLPERFEDLLFGCQSPCAVCKRTTVHTKALCLVCGKVFCVDSACFRSHCESGSSCRLGVLLLLELSKMLFFRDTGRFTIWASCYLDEFGEEDAGLQRGKPLRLNHQAFAFVQWAWRLGMFDCTTQILDVTFCE